jgi:acetylornithine deacetylase
MKPFFVKAGFLLAASLTADARNVQQSLGNSLATIESSVVSLHKSLVDRPSVTGSERNVSLFLQTYLIEAGFTVELQFVEKDRHNVFAYLGDKRESKVLVTSHIDTVPPHIPYARKGDEIWGRGSADAKGSVAAQITAVEALRRDGKIRTGDVALLFVVGEERGGTGMKAANDLGLSWDVVIFGEPTELKLARGHKGGMGFNITARGKASHSGYPELGRNAIDILIQGLSLLQSVELPGSDEFGATTLNVGTISGGVAPNVVPEDASATALVRLAVDDPAPVKQLITQAALEASPWLQVEFSTYAIGPVTTDYDIEGEDKANI